MSVQSRTIHYPDDEPEIGHAERSLDKATLKSRRSPSIPNLKSTLAYSTFTTLR